MVRKEKLIERTCTCVTCGKIMKVGTPFRWLKTFENARANFHPVHAERCTKPIVFVAPSELKWDFGQAGEA